jgi:hypothetical protein
LSERDAFPLGHDIIHSVTNPIGRLTGAIHVYGGDFFGVPRSEWDLERLTEQPYDVQKALHLFEESNRFHSAQSVDQSCSRFTKGIRTETELGWSRSRLTNRLVNSASLFASRPSVTLPPFQCWFG